MAGDRMRFTPSQLRAIREACNGARMVLYAQHGADWGHVERGACDRLCHEARTQHEVLTRVVEKIDREAPSAAQGGSGR